MAFGESLTTTATWASFPLFPSSEIVPFAPALMGTGDLLGSVIGNCFVMLVALMGHGPVWKVTVFFTMGTVTVQLAPQTWQVNLNGISPSSFMSTVKVTSAPKSWPSVALTDAVYVLPQLRSQSFDPNWSFEEHPGVMITSPVLPGATSEIVRENCTSAETAATSIAHAMIVPMDFIFVCVYVCMCVCVRVCVCVCVCCR